MDSLAPQNYLQSFEYEETNISKALGQMNGQVSKHEESYGFVKYPRYPQEIYTNTSYSDEDEWQNIQLNSDIKFRVGFNRKGPVAIKIQARFNLVKQL